MAPPAEALGSGSPHGPRDPPRTCSGLRPPEAERARASRKVRKRGKEGELGVVAGPRGRGNPRSAAAPFPPGRPVRPTRAVPEGRRHARPEAAGRGDRACFPRALGAASGKPPWPRRALRAFPQAEVAQRLFPATEVLFGPTGAPRFGSAALGRHYGDLVPFIDGSEHQRARTPPERPAPWLRRGGLVALSPASRGGGFGGCQLWRRACV